MIFDRIPVRTRLSLSHAIWMALIFIAIGVGVMRVVQDSIMQALDNGILATARSIRDSREYNLSAIAGSPDKKVWESVFRDFFNDGRMSIRAYAQLVDMSGKVRVRSGNIWVNLPVTPIAVARAEKSMETFETFHWKNIPPWRQVTLPLVVNGHFTGELIQVGTPLDETYGTLKSLKTMLWLTLSIGLCISVIFGYLLTRWSLRPVVRITKAAGALSVEDLGQRLKLPPAKDELQTLVKTFNEMLNRLEDAFAHLRRFAGDVSHELRTPLTVLRGEAELALRRDRSPESYKETLKIIAHESQHMTHIVEDLLLLARAQGKSISMTWEDVDTNHFILELTNSVKSVYDQKQITLTVFNAAPALIRISPGYLSLALKNMLLNAAKHSPVGAAVEFYADMRGNTIEFRIVDHGEGIPPDALPHIFEAFYRADTARNRSAGGVGIGLSLARELVRLHGGAVQAQSEVDKGATFIARIPWHDLSKPLSSFARERERAADPKALPASI